MFPRPVPTPALAASISVPDSGDGYRILRRTSCQSPNLRPKLFGKCARRRFLPGLDHRRDRLFSFLPCRHVLPIFLRQPPCGRNAAASFRSIPDSEANSPPGLFRSSAFRPSEAPLPGPLMTAQLKSDSREFPRDAPNAFPRRQAWTRLLLRSEFRNLLGNVSCAETDICSCRRRQS